MAPRKRRPFTGLLCKPIDLADAKPRGLRVSLAEPPNESDVKTHIMEEIEARYIALDTFFSLDSNSLNIWEERAKALLTYRFEIPAYALQSWEHLARYLTHRYAPGFSLKRPSKNRFGAPLEWDYDKLAKLFADVEFLRRNTSMGLREIFEKLPTQTREYTKRWGRHRGKPGGLRKAYAKAKKLLDQDFKFQLHLCGGEVASRERPPADAARRARTAPDTAPPLAPKLAGQDRSQRWRAKQRFRQAEFAYWRLVAAKRNNATAARCTSPQTAPNPTTQAPTSDAATRGAAGKVSPVGRAQPRRVRSTPPALRREQQRLAEQRTEQRVSEPAAVCCLVRRIRGDAPGHAGFQPA